MKYDAMLKYNLLKDVRFEVPIMVDNEIVVKDIFTVNKMTGLPIGDLIYETDSKYINTYDKLTKVISKFNDLWFIYSEINYLLNDPLSKIDIPFIKEENERLTIKKEKIENELKDMLIDYSIYKHRYKKYLKELEPLNLERIKESVNLERKTKIGKIIEYVDYNYTKMSIEMIIKYLRKNNIPYSVFQLVNDVTFKVSKECDDKYACNEITICRNDVENKLIWLKMCNAFNIKGDIEDVDIITIYTY